MKLFKHFLKSFYHKKLEHSINNDLSSKITRLKKCVLFDHDYYLEKNQDVELSGISPEEHYILYGAREGRWASLFFRDDWYMDNHPEVRAEKLNPLFHYIDIGSKKGYDPNPFFDTKYYKNKYISNIGNDEPLQHFILNGYKCFNPSPRFNSSEYLKEIGRCDINPLKHYLEIGMKAGIPLARAEPIRWGDDVTSGYINLIKSSQLSNKNVLFITHTENGSIKKFVFVYAKALSEQGFNVFLIIASDYSKVEIPSELLNICGNILIRQNIGFDFAAWAHILKLYPELKKREQLLLTNDSIVGPLFDMSNIFHIIEKREYDLTGLTSNVEYAEHVQSFFLLFKKNILISSEFSSFWDKVINLSTKSKVIRDYEITMTARFRAKGFSVNSITKNNAGNNETIYNWTGLIDYGLPFIKMEIIKNADNATKTMVKKMMLSHNYDYKLVFSE